MRLNLGIIIIKHEATELTLICDGHKRRKHFQYLTLTQYLTFSPALKGEFLRPLEIPLL